MIIEGIDFLIQKKKVRYLRITIKNDNQVIVSAPLRMKEKQITEFLYKKLDWVKKHKSRVPPKELNICSLQNGDKLYLFGREYNLEIVKGVSNVLTYDNKNIRMQVNSDDEDTKKKLLKNLYRDEMKAKAEGYLTKWQNETGLKVAHMFIKDMKTRWGSCNITAKRIWLSEKLARFPEKCLEYVVLHEILHLAEKNHNKNFYSLLSYYLPEWKTAKTRLSTNE